MKKDPVCQMLVEERNALTAESDDKVFYFCSSGCREKFLWEKTIPSTSTDNRMDLMSMPF